MVIAIVPTCSNEWNAMTLGDRRSWTTINVIHLHIIVVRGTCITYTMANILHVLRTNEKLLQNDTFLHSIKFNIYVRIKIMRFDYSQFKINIVRHMTGGGGCRVAPLPILHNMLFSEEKILENILSHLTRNQSWPNLQNGGHFDWHVTWKSLS